jgi:hypothetical protein
MTHSVVAYRRLGPLLCRLREAADQEHSGFAPPLADNLPCIPAHSSYHICPFYGSASPSSPTTRLKQQPKPE